MTTPTLGVVGARGRMGTAVITAAQRSGWRIGLEGGRGRWHVSERPDAVVDVSHRTATPAVVRFCATQGVPLIHATSGLQPADEELLLELARTVAVVRAPNLALGHHLHREVLQHLAAQLAERPDREYEASLAERHPSHKRDRPSATLLALAALWRDSGTEVVSLNSVRGGLPVSDHTFVLTMGDEQLVVTHTVASLSAPAGGAVQAAAWATRATPGLYSMESVYGADTGISPNAVRICMGDGREA